MKLGVRGAFCLLCYLTTHTLKQLLFYLVLFFASFQACLTARVCVRVSQRLSVCVRHSTLSLSLSVSLPSLFALSVFALIFVFAAAFNFFMTTTLEGKAFPTAPRSSHAKKKTYRLPLDTHTFSRPPKAPTHKHTQAQRLLQNESTNNNRYKNIQPATQKLAKKYGNYCRSGYIRV